MGRVAATLQERHRAARRQVSGATNWAYAAVGLGLAALGGIGGFWLGSAHQGVTRTALHRELGEVSGRALIDELGSLDRTGKIEATDIVTYLFYEASKSQSEPRPLPSEPTSSDVMLKVPATSQAVVNRLATHETPGLTLQIQWFTSESDAQTARDKLRDLGLSAWLAVELRNGETRWRLSVGRYATQAQAKAAQALFSPLVAEQGFTEETPEIVSSRLDTKPSAESPATDE